MGFPKSQPQSSIGADVSNTTGLPALDNTNVSMVFACKHFLLVLSDQVAAFVCEHALLAESVHGKTALAMRPCRKLRVLNSLHR
jgi:hypothetical protein